MNAELQGISGTQDRIAKLEDKAEEEKNKQMAKHLMVHGIPENSQKLFITYMAGICSFSHRIISSKTIQFTFCSTIVKKKFFRNALLFNKEKKFPLHMEDFIPDSSHYDSCVFKAWASFLKKENKIQGFKTVMTKNGPNYEILKDKNWFWSSSPLIGSFTDNQELENLKIPDGIFPSYTSYSEKFPFKLKPFEKDGQKFYTLPHLKAMSKEEDLNRREPDVPHLLLLPSDFPSHFYLTQEGT